MDYIFCFVNVDIFNLWDLQWIGKNRGFTSFEMQIKRPTPYFNIKTVFPRCGNTKIIFNMAVPVLVRHLYIETPPQYRKCIRFIIMIVMVCHIHDTNITSKCPRNQLSDDMFIQSHTNYQSSEGLLGISMNVDVFDFGFNQIALI